MHKRPFMDPYCPNIVIVPGANMSYNDNSPVPAKKLKLDTIPMPPQPPLPPEEKLNDIPVPPPPLPSTDGRERAKAVHQVCDSEQLVVKTEISAHEESNERRAIERETDETKNISNKSWASNYMMSIGQFHSKPIKLNLSAKSSRKISTQKPVRNEDPTSAKNSAEKISKKKVITTNDIAAQSSNLTSTDNHTSCKTNSAISNIPRIPSGTINNNTNEKINKMVMGKDPYHRDCNEYIATNNTISTNKIIPQTLPSESFYPGINHINYNLNNYTPIAQHTFEDFNYLNTYGKHFLPVLGYNYHDYYAYPTNSIETYRSRHQPNHSVTERSYLDKIDEFLANVSRNTPSKTTFIEEQRYDSDYREKKVYEMSKKNELKDEHCSINESRKYPLGNINKRSWPSSEEKSDTSEDDEKKSNYVKLQRRKTRPIERFSRERYQKQKSPSHSKNSRDRSPLCFESERRSRSNISRNSKFDSHYKSEECDHNTKYSEKNLETSKDKLRGRSLESESRSRLSKSRDPTFYNQHKSEDYGKNTNYSQRNITSSNDRPIRRSEEYYKDTKNSKKEIGLATDRSVCTFLRSEEFFVNTKQSKKEINSSKYRPVRGIRSSEENNQDTKDYDKEISSPKDRPVRNPRRSEEFVVNTKQSEKEINSSKDRPVRRSEKYNQDTKDYDKEIGSIKDQPVHKPSLECNQNTKINKKEISSSKSKITREGKNSYRALKELIKAKFKKSLKERVKKTEKGKLGNSSKTDEIKSITTKKEPKRKSTNKSDQSSIKSVVQVKNASGSLDKFDDHFDLRSKILRKNLSKKSLKEHDNIPEKTLEKRDKLLITVANDCEGGAEIGNIDKPQVFPEDNTKKVKNKKLKKIKLVISMICENSDASDTDYETENEATTKANTEDISFLDDLNVDEIVSCLTGDKNETVISKNNKISIKTEEFKASNDNDTNNTNAEESEDYILISDDDSDASTVHLDPLEEIQDLEPFDEEDKNITDFENNNIFSENKSFQNKCETIYSNCENEKKTEDKEVIITFHKIKQEVIDEQIEYHGIKVHSKEFNLNFTKEITTPDAKANPSSLKSIKVPEIKLESEDVVLNNNELMQSNQTNFSSDNSNAEGQNNQGEFNVNISKQGQNVEKIFKIEPPEETMGNEFDCNSENADDNIGSINAQKDNKSTFTNPDHVEIKAEPREIHDSTYNPINSNFELTILNTTNQDKNSYDFKTKDQNNIKVETEMIKTGANSFDNSNRSEIKGTSEEKQTFNNIPIIDKWANPHNTNNEESCVILEKDENQSSKNITSDVNLLSEIGYKEHVTETVITQTNNTQTTTTEKATEISSLKLHEEYDKTKLTVTEAYNSDQLPKCHAQGDTIPTCMIENDVVAMIADTGPICTESDILPAEGSSFTIENKVTKEYLDEIPVKEQLTKNEEHATPKDINVKEKDNEEFNKQPILKNNEKYTVTKEDVNESHSPIQDEILPVKEQLTKNEEHATPKDTNVKEKDNEEFDKQPILKNNEKYTVTKEDVNESHSPIQDEILPVKEQLTKNEEHATPKDTNVKEKDNEEFDKQPILKNNEKYTVTKEDVNESHSPIQDEILPVKEQLTKNEEHATPKDTNVKEKDNEEFDKQPILKNNEKYTVTKKDVNESHSLIQFAAHLTKVNTDSKTANINKNEPYEQNFVICLEKRMLKCLQESYKVISVLHRGNFSKIFRCQNIKGDDRVVKVMKPKCDSYLMGKMKENMLKRLQRDIPNENLHLIRVYDGFPIKGQWSFVMQYYPKNLNQALEQSEKPFHINLVQSLSRQLIAAMTVLRNNNIVHSDITPSHILLNEDNSCLKICGFDKANDFNNLVPTWTSVSYRPPEIILGYSTGFSIDVWSTALVMFEMATKHQLFPGQYNNDILFKQLCTCGYVPVDMIEGSRFAYKHFRGTTFMRRCGVKGQDIVLKTPQEIYKNSKLKGSILSAYYNNWGQFRTIQERREDYKKLFQFYKLLEAMLQMHPSKRLPIEYAYTHNFLFKV